jgi:hypothetical protein
MLFMPAPGSRKRRTATQSNSAWITRWGVVVAACITALGVIVVGILNLAANTQVKKSAPAAEEAGGSGSCGAGTLSITSVRLADSRTGRAVHVDGRWTGPPLSNSEIVYAIARPVGSAELGEVPGRGKSADGTRSWYVSPGNFGEDGAWRALIEISPLEKRELVIQAICARPCPEDRACNEPFTYIPIRTDPEDPTIRTQP